ncbi:hypothetical protein, partial [Mycobacterium sp.]
MARGIRRFDRRIRPTENTDVFPAIRVDDDTGAIPVPDAEPDDEHAGLETDKESSDQESSDVESPVTERWSRLRDQGIQLARYLGRRLIQISAVVLAWLS